MLRHEIAHGKMYASQRFHPADIQLRRFMTKRSMNLIVQGRQPRSK